MTPAMSLFSAFRKSLGRRDIMQGLTILTGYIAFSSKLEKYTPFKTKVFDGQVWFLLSHPECPDRRIIPDNI
jgi:hypothetical protein